MVEYLHNLHTEVDIGLKHLDMPETAISIPIFADDLSQEEFERRMELAMEKILPESKRTGRSGIGEHGIGLPRSHI